MFICIINIIKVCSEKTNTEYSNLSVSPCCLQASQPECNGFAIYLNDWCQNFCAGGTLYSYACAQGIQSWNNFNWQGTLEVIWLSPLVKACRLDQVAQGQIFNISKDGDSIGSLGNPFYCLSILLVKCVFLTSSQNFCCCYL